MLTTWLGRGRCGEKRFAASCGTCPILPAGVYSHRPLPTRGARKPCASPTVGGDPSIRNGHRIVRERDPVCGRRGWLEIGGTFAAVIAGAAPGTPPRGDGAHELRRRQRRCLLSGAPHIASIAREEIDVERDAARVVAGQERSCR